MHLGFHEESSSNPHTNIYDQCFHPHEEIDNDYSDDGFTGGFTGGYIGGYGGNGLLNPGPPLSPPLLNYINPSLKLIYNPAVNPTVNTMNSGGQNNLEYIHIGDNVCHDYLNRPECGFDEGDCCQTDVIEDEQSTCYSCYCYGSEECKYVIK